MPELETLAIVSLKDPAKRWVINKSEYDPEIHTPWEADDAEAPAQAAADPVDFDELDMTPPAASEPASDFLPDGMGGITKISIVDPADARKRKVVAGNEYNPDTHTLWSERKR